jgi:hypothetical protein
MSEDAIAAHIGRLAGAAPAETADILADLAAFGTDAIDPMLELLADPRAGDEMLRITLVLAVLRLGAPPLAVGEQILGATRTMSPLPLIAAELLKYKDLARTTPTVDATLADAARLSHGVECARALVVAGPMAPIVARAILYESRAASQRALAAWALASMGDRDEELLEPLVAVLAARDMEIAALAAEALGRLGDSAARAPLEALVGRLAASNRAAGRGAHAAATAALARLSADN